MNILKAVISVILAVGIASGAFFYGVNYETESSAATMHEAEAVSAASAPTAISEASDSIVITKTGTRFHLESCSTVSGKLTAHIERAEAEKLFTPCKTCNP